MPKIMGKIRDIFKGPHKYFACFVVAVTAAFLLFWLVGSGNTFINWAKAGIEIRHQEKTIRQYELENAEMDSRINMLKNDKDTLEKFAREQYNFAVPGEDVYIVEE
jgi:cell division protein FtsB